MATGHSQVWGKPLTNMRKKARVHFQQVSIKNPMTTKYFLKECAQEPDYMDLILSICHLIMVGPEACFETSLRLASLLCTEEEYKGISSPGSLWGFN